jgi:hypothetical protein
MADGPNPMQPSDELQRQVRLMLAEAAIEEHNRMNPDS